MMLMYRKVVATKRCSRIVLLRQIAVVAAELCCHKTLESSDVPYRGV